MFSNGYEAKKLMGTLSKERELEIFASKIIVDDVLLCELKEKQLLEYFIIVLNVLKHHCATLKIKG